MGAGGPIDSLILINTALGVANYNQNSKQSQESKTLQSMEQAQNQYFVKLIEQNEMLIKQNVEIINLLRGG